MIVVFDKSSAAPSAAPDAATLARAWALKEQCYAAWSSEPQRAAIAAVALRALCATDAADADPVAREIEALADWTEGIAHITRARMAEATASFDASASAFRRLGQAANAAQTQVPKIVALSMLGQYDAAIDCAERAQREFVALGDAQGAGKVSGNLGALYERRGAYVQAARHSRDASMLFARVGDHERSIQSDINLANALTSMGDFDEALRIYARARMRAGTHHFPVLEALVEEAVAQLDLARGQYRGALAGFESARRSYEQLGMPQNVAVAEKFLADTYLELCLLPEAVALFDQVLSRQQAFDVPDEQAWTLAQRGRAQALMGRREQAAQSFERAATLFAAQGNGVGAATVTLARAELALDGGDAAQATELAARAGEGFAAAQRADGRTRADIVRAYSLLRAGSVEQARALFNAALADAQLLQLLTLQVHCRVGQGLAAQALGDAAAARAAFDDAVEGFEDQRRALPGDDFRSAFLGDRLQPYQELLRLDLQAHAAAPSSGSALEVLHQLERVRARSLGERLDGDAAPADDPASRALRERLNWLYRRVRRLDEEGESSAPWTEELRRTERELLEGARRARLTATPLPGVKSDAGRFDADTLQAALGDGGALIEYGVLDDELFACIVTPAGVHLQRHVASWREVQEALRAARFQIETLRHGAAPVRQHLASLTARTQRRLELLHALVWAPLAPALEGSRRVLVVPCGPLGLLPFAALHDGAQALAQRFELALVPSARLGLRGLLRTPRAPRRALALGESSRLPHAAYEARFVAGLFEQGTALVGTQATLQALREHAPQADLIHLACHAQFRNDNPMFSALHLHDAALSVEAVETLVLQPGTVVLSACETGVAEGGGGEERVGLVRAFLVAGAARVLASLWPVDDEVTGAFMANFYAALRAGEPPARALQQAQTRQRATHPHPFYWAAFTLHGGW